MSHRVELATTLSPHTLSDFQNSQVLYRQAAKSRLQQLTPGTEEHRQLQNALLRTTGIVEIHLPTTLYRVDTCSEDCRLLGGFGSSEHVAIGAAVKLKGLPENTPLLSKGTSRIQFQHIVALAGDFYGIVGAAISLLGGTDAEKTERFKQAFNTLAEANNDQLQGVVLEINQECSAVQHASLPHHCYSSQMLEKNKAIKKLKHDIDDLLIDNSDHFSTNAEDAYRIGHAYALSVAKIAGKRKDLEGLKFAYALDGFACHFLTDLFAAGHVRNQRGPLESFLINQLGFSPSKAKLLAGILTGAQHEKDGNEGLNVANKKGEHWRAYGDGCYFTPKNKDNKEKAVAATQQSVDEIYNAYVNADSPEPFQSIVDQFIPHVTPVNPLPLYSIEGASLFLPPCKIPITTQLGYLTKCIPQALRYLPEKYIQGFTIPEIELHPVIDKVILPIVERLTGAVWHVIGLATYSQVKQEAQRLNEKMDEMADALMATYDKTVEILTQLQQLKSQVNQLVRNNLFQEIREPMQTIRDIVHQNKIHPGALSEMQQIEAEKQLWAAYIRMSRVLSEGTTDNKNVLAAYREMLTSSETIKGDSEIEIAVTLWFRQMLDYQAKAFSLYEALQVKREGYKEEIRTLASQFESQLIQQLEINEKHINKSLISESQSYIALQLEISKTKRSAFAS